MMKKYTCVLWVLSVTVIACKTTQTTQAPVNCDAAPLTYIANIKPIIDTECTSCHKKGFGYGDFTSFPDIKEMVTSGKFKREVVDKKHMPPNKALSTEDLKKITCWLQSGGN